MTNTMAAAAPFDPAGSRKSISSEVSHLLTAPRPSSIFAVVQPEGFGVFKIENWQQPIPQRWNHSSPALYFTDGYRWQGSQTVSYGWR